MSRRWLALVVGAAAAGAALIGCVPPPAPSTIYYVDAANGHDGATGTANDPLRRISEALGRAGPGTMVAVRGGDYRFEGNIAATLAGTRQAPIWLQADGGGQVLVERLTLTSSQWVEIRGLTVRGNKSLPSGWQDMPAVVVDDPSVVIDPSESWATRAAKVDQKYASYAQFQSATGAPSWETTYFSAGIDVVASTDITIAANDVSLHTVGIRLKNGSSRITVQGNTIHHCLDALRGDKRAVDEFSFESSSIRFNTVDQIFREGLRLTAGARDNFVVGNTVRYTGHNHIATYDAGGGNTIAVNRVEYGGYYTETMRWPGSSAISVHSAGPGTVVNANYAAYQVDVTLRDGNGVIIDYTPEGARVVNNVVYRVMGSGISSTHSGNSTIVHNTLVEVGHETTSLKNGVGIRMVTSEDTNSIIANNVIERPSIGGILFEAGTMSSQAFFDYNLYHTLGRPLVGNGLQPQDLYYTLASLQAAGFGLHEVDADPLLSNPEAGQFWPLPGSPAHDAGTPLHSHPTDAAWAARDAVAPTIGAYE